MPEHKTLMTVKTPLPGVEIDARSLNGTETLGRLFEYNLELTSLKPDIAGNDLLGKPMTIHVEPADTPGRFFNGLVTEFYHVGERERHTEYRAIIRPWLWILSQRGTCRIFQNLFAKDIIEQVFRDAGFTDFSFALEGSYTTREFCVQYRESDFNFVSRLMEQEGMYYYFEHADGKHTLKIVDAASKHASTKLGSFRYIPTQSMIRDQYIAAWSNGNTLQTGKFLLNDYDFENPTGDLKARAATPRPYALGDRLEQYYYPGPHERTADGNHFAGVRLGERQSQHSRFNGAGPIASLVCGQTFEMEDHPREDQNAKFIALSTTYTVMSNPGGEAGASGEDSVNCSFEAIKTDEPYRSPSITPKPLIQGPQTAVVVGPTDNEIWTDKYGRVKLQFHWDLLGKKDENSSCWVRVAQVWAGRNWGAMHIPRIGQEVVVEFLEGDPDRPLVTGRVYNAGAMPPYALPANQTQSGLKSRSTTTGNEETFNELRFEDKKDSEEIYFHAEKNFTRIVENNDVLKVGDSKKDKGDQTIDIFNSQTVTIGLDGCEEGSKTLTVLKDRTATVKEGNETLTVQKGNRMVTLDKGNDKHQLKTGNREVLVDQGNDKLTVTTGNQEVKVTAGTSTLEAGTAIELKVGASSIKIEAAGITIKSPVITVEASGKLSLKGTGMAELNSSGILTIQGSIVKIN